MTGTEHMALVNGASIELAYMEDGDRRDPTVLLVMGLGGQLVHWPDGFVRALVERRLHVLRFDNRDSGRSTRCSNGPKPDFPAAMRGDLSSVAYTLSDMAADAVGLLDALGIPAAHVVGASMGGAIAQTMAIEQPSRVISLTSMMFTTGDPAVGQPHPEVLKAMGGGTADTREAFVERAVRMAQLLSPTGTLPDITAIAATAGTAFDRGHDDVALTRQAIATVASGDRTSRLQKLRLPTLVVHGRGDKLCDVSGGIATAKAIPDARLVVIERMGHGLPAEIWSQLADLVAETIAEGEERARRG
jgi:pimeloyl-ACP methyl ester carboxylesterase